MRVALRRCLPWLAALGAWMSAASIHAADFPALSRPLIPASFSSRLPAATSDRRGVEGSASVAWFSRSRVPATADPRITGGEIGGRGEAGYLYGRFKLAGDATVDGSFNVDSREYPSR